MKRIKCEMNWFDRWVVAPFAPDRAIRNGILRAQLQSGSYHGGSSARRQVRSWNPSAGSADADTLDDLPTMRQRSRDAKRNQPVAGAAIRNKVSNVIGLGLTPQSTPMRALLPAGTTDEEIVAFQRLAEAVWAFHSSSTSIDFERRHAWRGHSRLGYESSLENGDALGLIRMRPSYASPLQTCIQLIEADRVSNPDGRADGAEAPGGRGNTISGGVETNRNGVKVAYWILDQHPGDTFAKKRTWRRVSSVGSQGQPLALHLMKPDRIGQSRGVPDLAPVLEILHTLTGYSESECQAALVGSFFAVAVTNQAGTGLSVPAWAGQTGDGVSTDADSEIELSNGIVAYLKSGQDIKQIKAERPNSQYEPFVKAHLKQLAARLGIGIEPLLQAFESSYSAARASLLQAWRLYFEERGWWVEVFCQPAYEAVIFEAIGLGIIPVPRGFFDSSMTKWAWLCSEWDGPAPIQLDPMKEAAAAKLMVDEGFSTRAKKSRELGGGDFETNHHIRAKEEAMRRADGLDREGTAERVSTRSAVEQAGKQPPGPPDPDPDQEPADDAEEMDAEDAA